MGVRLLYEVCAATFDGKSPLCYGVLPIYDADVRRRIVGARSVSCRGWNEGSHAIRVIY